MAVNPEGHEYCVSHVDGRAIDPDSTFLILRLDTDPQARAAALYYAKLIRKTNPGQFKHIAELVGRYMRPAWSPAAPRRGSGRAKRRTKKLDQPR